MGYAPGDPFAETADQAMDQGAHFQMANVGLAVAENAALTEWGSCRRSSRPTA